MVFSTCKFRADWKKSLKQKTFLDWTSVFKTAHNAIAFIRRNTISLGIGEFNQKEINKNVKIQ